MIRSLALFLCLTAGSLLAQEAAGHETEKGHATTASHDAGDPLLSWKWINFGFLVLGIGYLLRKHAVPAFRERRQDILDALNAGVRRSEEAAAKAREIDARLAGLHKEVESIRTSAKAEMQLEAERVRQETTALLQKVERGAQQEIASAAKEAMNQLKSYSADLAIQLAEQKLRTRLTADRQSELVRTFVAKMSAAGKN